MLRKNDLKMREELINLKQIIMIPRAHFKKLESLKYDEMVEQKNKLQNSTIGSLKKNSKTSRQNYYHHRSGSTTITNTFESTPVRKFPKLRHRSRMRNISQDVTEGIILISYYLHRY